MLKILVKQRLSMLLMFFSGGGRTAKKQSAGKMLAFAALMLYALGALGFLMWHVFDTLAQPFRMLGVEWLFFSFAAVMSFGLMFIGSVFSAKAQLYEAKDNDLLLSLPLRPRDILLSRLLLLLTINYILDLVAAVPALMVGRSEGLLSTRGTVFYVIVFLLLPLLTLAVGALFAWVLSLLTSRVRHKSLVTTVLSFAFFVAYMVVNMRLNNILLSLAADPSGLASSLGAIAPVVWMGRAIAEESVPALLGAAALMLGAFVLMYILLSATFIKTATGQRGVTVKRAAGAVKAGSVRSALLRREFLSFFNCPAYMINAGLGTVMALAACVVLPLKAKDAVAAMQSVPGMEEIIHPILLAAMCVMGSMMLFTTPSVSLEAKTLWLTQSLPVDVRDILRAKLILHAIMGGLPMLALSVVAALVFRPTGLMLVLFLVLPTLFTLLIGLLGLAENLRHPMLNWTSETQAVKSGIGVLFTIFIAWGVLAVPVLVIVLLSADPLLTAGVFTLASLAVCVLLYRLLMSWGVRKYKEL